MVDRKRFHWKVQVVPISNEEGQAAGGQVVTRDFICYWDPNREGMAEEVGTACAAMETVQQGLKKKYTHVGVEYVGTEPVAA